MGGYRYVQSNEYAGCAGRYLNARHEYTVSMVFSQIEKNGPLQAHPQRRLQHHINRMWLEKMPESETFLAASEPNPIASEQLGIVFTSIKPKV